MRTIPVWATALTTLILVACSHGSKVANDQIAFLDQLGITVTTDLMLGESITMPDVYCGDPQQTVDDLKGLGLNHEQYAALVEPAGKGFADEMSNWVLLGVRDAGNGITLAAYYAGNGLGYCVELFTYDRKGHVLDAINARELHLLWRCNLGDPKDNSAFTLDGFITFEKHNRVTLYRTMGRCIMDFEGDLKGKPQWQQEWAQEYVINEKGHFVMQGQHIVNEEGKVDYYAALDFKSWDMLVCSMHDLSIMDTWNDYAELVNSTYDPDYQYNPFPWDVAQLYHMNPQRFLQWMFTHRGSGNRLLPQFKLPPDERPALLEEINRIGEAGARQWLTALVNSWDDRPLTKHL